MLPPLVEPDGAAELDGLEELDEDDDGVLLEPAPAEPVVPELEGAALDDEDAPPLAWSFLFTSIDVDEELEPEGAALGELVAPPADEDEDEPAGDDGEAVEPEGAVLDELDEPAGPRLSPRSQPESTAAPNAMETARANVESFMWPPWLGY